MVHIHIENYIALAMLSLNTPPHLITNLYKDVGVGNYIWIYNWNVKTEQFYCIPIQKEEVFCKKIRRLRNPATVTLNNFAQKYNHLVIVTKYPDLFQD